MTSSVAHRTPALAGCCLFLVTALFGCGCASAGRAGTATLSGEAFYRERIGLPPEAAFEATIENVARADAPAEVIAHTRIDSPGQPPIRFSIAYDPARLEPSGRYVVRARILHGDALMFVSDTANALPAPDSPTPLRILLRRVAPAQSSGAASVATTMKGIYSYLADAGSFTDCRTGERYPVAQEADNAALEASYGKVRPAPGAPVLATVEGRVQSRASPDGGAARPTLVVERVVALSAGEGCSGPVTAATLENTYWKLVSLRGRPVVTPERQREAHLILQPQTARVVGSAGCNRISGPYTLAGTQLSFARIAGTLMACPQGMETEREFLAALAAVATWRITGQQLELLDAAGEPLAGFDSRLMK